MATEVADVLYWGCKLFTTQYEKTFSPIAFQQFAQANYWVPFGCVVVYLLGCHYGSEYMKSRKPFDLRMELSAWNGCLCLFSFIGMCRTVPFLFANILTRSFESTVCSSPLSDYGVGVTGFWVMLFIFSKIPELVDTLFIVLRKKPLIFLHWYHHVSVLLFCWNAYATSAGSGLYFVAMNYSVHALMYGYYCLQSLGMCPKSFPAILITISQIAQMIIGTAVCCSAWYFSFTSPRPCHNDMSNLLAGAVMYGSYLYLFVDFAVNRYGKPQKGRTSSKALSKQL
jgi:elongation of very long chain fatty acids protein 6